MPCKTTRQIHFYCVYQTSNALLKTQNLTFLSLEIHKIFEETLSNLIDTKLIDRFLCDKEQKEVLKTFLFSTLSTNCCTYCRLK